MNKFGRLSIGSGFAYDNAIYWLPFGWFVETAMGSIKGHREEYNK